MAVGGLGTTTSAAQIKEAFRLPAVVAQVGAILSLTVIVAVKVVLVLPHSSSASQVIVLEKLFAQAPGVVTSLT